MWRQDFGVVNELKAWFEEYWNSPVSEDYKGQLIEALRQTRFGGEPYKPYQVLIRTLSDRYGLERPPSLEQATFTLKWFQNDAAFRLIKMLAGPARGALLADAVGMGKTFIAMAVAYHYLHQQRQTVRGKPVRLIIPASLRRTRWRHGSRIATSRVRPTGAATGSSRTASSSGRDARHGCMTGSSTCAPATRGIASAANPEGRRSGIAR